MPILTDEMRRLVREQRLGYIATVCPDNTPNLSPKGTTSVWDETHLIFADICSPGTVENLRHNPAIEINVVDPILRKGYRFKGTATIHSDGPLFAEAVAFYRQCGTASPIAHIVLMEVTRALPLISPAYDLGATEDEIRRRWGAYYAAIRPAGGE